MNRKYLTLSASLGCAALTLTILMLTLNLPPVLGQAAAAPPPPEDAATAYADRLVRIVNLALEEPQKAAAPAEEEIPLDSPSTPASTSPTLLNAGAPVAAAEMGLDAGPRTPQAPPLPGPADIVVSMGSDRVWGIVGAGERVTVTVDGVQMGAALADANGFFWTTLYAGSGYRPALSGGETVAIYHEGVQAAATTLRATTGALDPLLNEAAGTIPASSPIDVIVYPGWEEPGVTTYSQTVTSDASGNFVASFAGTFDLVADGSAVAAYVENGIEVQQRLYAHRLVVQPFPFSSVLGYTTPDSAVTATVYLSDATTVKETLTAFAAPHTGRYEFSPSLDTGDVVVLEVEGGTILSRTVDTLTPPTVDAINDQILGTAVPGVVVRGHASALTADGWQRVMTSTTAGATGAYTLTFAADLVPGRWAGVYVADGEGDDLNLWAPASSVVVNQTHDEVTGRAPAPPGSLAEGHPIHLTLQQGAQIVTATKGAGWYGEYSFTSDDGLPAIGPGDVVTITSSGYSWAGVVEVSTMTVASDVSADRVSGAIVPPTQRVELFAEQWDGWSDTPLYPVGGSWGALTTTSDTFTFTTEGFDLRNAVDYDVIHRTATEYAEQVSAQIDWLRLWPQYNGLLALLAPAGTPYTVTLYDAGGSFKAQHTGTSSEPIGHAGFIDFNSLGATLEVDDRVMVRSAAGFSQTVIARAIDVTMDAGEDLISGSAPPNALINVYVDNKGQGFVPTDGAGNFAVRVSDLQVVQNANLRWGDFVRVCYNDPNANHVCYNADWPQIVAHYDESGQNDVWGTGAEPGSTLLITVTEPGVGVVATAATPAGSGDQGTGSYRQDFPDGTLVPGRIVVVDFGGGIVEATQVVSITGTADPDAELVSGTAPPTSTLSLNASHEWGGWINVSAQVDANGVYTADFGANGWNIRYRDTFNVHYTGFHNHQTQYSFKLAAADVQVDKSNTNGVAVPGGTYLYRINYSNQGDAPAENVVITDSLPVSTTYAGDSSGLPLVDGGTLLTWTVGTLEPNAQHEFYVALHLDTGLPQQSNLDPNCVAISTSSPGDRPDGNANCSAGAWIDAGDAGIWVDKWPEPQDPHPGAHFGYVIDYGSDGSGATGPIWLTDTLPISTTFVSWQEENGNGALWTEVLTTGGHFVLHAPAGMPGNFGGRIRLTLQLDPAVPAGTQLTNHIVVTTSNDVNPANNSDTDTSARAGEMRYDVRVDKHTNGGSLVPGGELYYNLYYENRGNVPVHAWITDTLPAGTSYQDGSANTGGFMAQPFPPADVTGESVAWDLGELAVNESMNLNFTLDVSPTLSPGVITNCATIAITATDAAPWDNDDCVQQTINPAGPNLRVDKQHNWHGDDRLHYQIHAENTGDQTLYGVRITDTYPLSTTFSGEWGFDPYPANVEFTHTNGQLIWTLELLEPGWGWQGWFNTDLDAPGELVRWYTNTVAVTEFPGETTPADNTYTDVAFSGGEVQQVNVNVGQNYLQGQTAAGPITVTTAFTQVVFPWSGNFQWNAPHTFEPGDIFTVAAGQGLLPIVVTIPDPFTAHASSITNTVWGQIDALDSATINVRLDGGANRDVTTAGAGHYVATFTDVPRGGQGWVNYNTTIDYAGVRFSRQFQSPDLLLEVNYAHDWVQGYYDEGHTVWITVTDSGGAIKATAEMTTQVTPWWGGQTGFSTNLGQWDPSQPDVVPGDWVHGKIDNGYTSTVQIGTLTGNVDAAADTITGTLAAPWITEMVEIQCHAWGAPMGTPNKEDLILPDGSDPYACSWDPGSEWDIEPGQQIAVQYYEPDGDSVYDVYAEPVPDLYVRKEAHGTPGTGGNLRFTISYGNDGGAPAENVVITETLYGMGYIFDTSPFTILTQTLGPVDELVAYTVGTVEPDTHASFDVFVSVEEPAGSTITNTAEIVTSTPYNQSEPWEAYQAWSGQVSPNGTELNVGKSAWTSDPLPGTSFVWGANVCNYGSTASDEVILTDTLPLSTTLNSWWSNDAGWIQLSPSGTDQLVLTYYALGEGACSEVYLNLDLHPNVQPGTQLTNTAEITATTDGDPNDNVAFDHVWASGPHTNLSIDKSWSNGQLVPGGELRYNVYYNNGGNVPITETLYITDTLPVSTTFREMHVNYGPALTQVQVTDDYVVWALGGLPNGYSGDFQVVLDVDPGAAPGTILTNTAAISLQPSEDSESDNADQVVEQLYASGPNLRVTKEGGWHGYGEGHNAWYQITVENVGTEMAANVNFTDTYPAEMELDGDPNVNWEQIHGYNRDDANHTFSLVFDQLNPGDRQNVDFNVLIPGTDPVTKGLILTNTAWISTVPNEVRTEDNTDVAILTTGPDLYVEKHIADGEILPGELITFSLTFGNAREGHEYWWNTLGNVVLTDTLPAELEFVTSTLRWCGGSEWCVVTPTVAGQAYGWTFDPLGAGAWNKLYLTARITETATGSDSFTNWATIASTEPLSDTEPYLANNTATALVAIQQPVFEVGKRYASSEVAGTAITYTLTVTNTGNAEGTNVVLSDTIPAGLSDVSSSGGSVAPPGVLWTLPSIPAGAAETAEFSAILPCSGSVTNDDYRVTGSDQGATSASGPPVTLDVAAPALQAAIEQSAASAELGQSVTFTATATTDGPDVLTRTWAFGDDTGGSGTAITHTYAVTGTFTLALTVTDRCGYSAIATTTVTVTAPTLTAAFEQSAAALALGESLALTDTTTSSAGIAARLWHFGDGTTATGATVTHTYAATGTFTLALTVTDTLGFTDTATGTVTVSAEPPPTLTAAFEQSATALALGESLALTDTTTSSASVAARLWHFGDGTTATGATVTHTYAATGTVTLALTVTDTLGFTDSATGTVTISAEEVSDHKIYLPLIVRNTG